MRIRWTRRAVLAGAGAFGLSGVLSACGGDGGDGGDDGQAAPGAGSGGGLGAGANAATPLQIDATEAACGVPAAVPMYAYITGSVTPAGGQQTFYRWDATGQQPAEMALSDNTLKGGAGDAAAHALTGLAGALYQQNYPLDWAHYGIPLARDQPTVIADLARFQRVPGLGTGTAALSARVWISVGKPLLPFTPQTNAGGRVTGYAAADFTAGAAGALCFFDFMEFSYDSSGALNVNPSLVDQFGLPMTVWTADAGGNPTEKQGRFTVTRAALLDAIAGLDTDFNTPVTLPTNADIAVDAYPLGVMRGRILRQISPSKASKNQNSSYLATAVAHAYSGWTPSTPLAVTNSGNATGNPDLQTTYYGYAVNGNTLAFFADRNLAGAPLFAFDDLTTSNIYSCAGSADGSRIPPATPGDLRANILNTGKALLAAFNRGVADASTRVLDITPNALVPPASAYYRVANVRSNQWAQYLHGVSTNGRVYAFGYDDVGDQNPSIDTPNARGLFIQLGAFGVA